MSNESPKRFLTRADVARELGLSQHAVNQAIRRGQLPSIRIGGRILISRSRLESWLKSAEHSASQPKSAEVQP